LCLAAGTLLNVILAQALSQSTTGARRVRDGTATEAEARWHDRRLARHEWPITVTPEEATYIARTVVRFGMRQFTVIGAHRAGGGGVRSLVFEHRAGFPFKSMGWSQESIDERGSSIGPPIHHGAIRGHHRGAHLPGSNLRFTLVSQIHAPAFVANSLLYGAGFALALGALRRARAGHRRRHGRCPACGHRLVSPAPCPECGAGPGDG
jgi:hypothetical protein